MKQNKTRFLLQFINNSNRESITFPGSSNSDTALSATVNIYTLQQSDDHGSSRPVKCSTNTLRGCSLTWLWVSAHQDGEQNLSSPACFADFLK